MPRKGSQRARSEGIKFVSAEKVRPHILVIAGRTSAGKTHLLHALASFAKRNYFIQSVACLSSVQFADEIRQGLHFGDLPHVLQRFADDSLLALDDIDRLLGQAELADALLNVLQMRQVMGKRSLLSITLSHEPLSDHPISDFLVQQPAVSML